jgi:translation elongation factor EF-1alpha
LEVQILSSAQVEKNFEYILYMAKEKEIGTVTHWYDKISVAVVRLSSALSVGDTVMVRHGENEFEITIDSMQIDHENVSKGKKGDEIAIKLPKKAKEGSIISAE